MKTLRATPKFKLGHTVMTQGIAAMGDHTLDLMHALYKHQHGDWGDTCKEDAKMNDIAVANGERIVSKYKIGTENIFVITEWDRSVTTLMLCEEY
jgi:hypothetical protein